MRLLRHPAVHWLLAIAVGAVFVYASLSKISDPRAFAKIIYHYQVIGPSATFGFVPANLLAVALPWLELITGVLLVTGLWRRDAALVSAVMLAVFVAAVGSTLARGIDIQNCGCFALDESGRSAGWKLIAGDLALLAAALVGAFVPTRAVEPAVETAPVTAP
jgi:putative oxidoreductase